MVHKVAHAIPTATKIAHTGLKINHSIHTALNPNSKSGKLIRDIGGAGAGLVGNYIGDPNLRQQYLGGVNSVYKGTGQVDKRSGQINSALEKANKIHRRIAQRG